MTVAAVTSVDTPVPGARAVRPASGERGAVTAFVAVLMVALLAVAGLVVDGGRALAAAEQDRAVAEQAARLGADEVSVAGLRAGSVSIDPAAARSAVTAYLQRAGVTGTVAADPTEVVVTVRQALPTAILSIVGIDHMVVHASATATDVHGVSQADG